MGQFVFFCVGWETLLLTMILTEGLPMSYKWKPFLLDRGFAVQLYTSWVRRENFEFFRSKSVKNPCSRQLGHLRCINCNHLLSYINPGGNPIKRYLDFKTTKLILCALAMCSTSIKIKTLNCYALHIAPLRNGTNWVTF